MKRLWWLCMACGLPLAAPLAAQDAGEMDRLLETPAVSASRAAWFVLGPRGSCRGLRAGRPPGGRGKRRLFKRPKSGAG